MIPSKNKKFTYNDFLTTFFAHSIEEANTENDPFEFGTIISNKALKSIRKSIVNLKILPINGSSSLSKLRNQR